MKPRAFRYLSVHSLEELFQSLAEHGDDAKILAGGQSLVPMMNLRLASPSVILDINNCAELGGIARQQSGVRIGALTRHRETEHSAIVRDHLPLVAQAMPHVAHLAVRNRGTLGGSLALADPAAEMPACALLLGATMELGSKRGARRVDAADFFQGLYSTILEPDEALLAVEYPDREPDDVFGFLELSRRHGDFAIAGIAAGAKQSEHGLRQVRIVGFGISDRPLRLSAVETLVEHTKTPLSLSAIKDALREDVTPEADNQYSADMKVHLASELVRRAVRDLEGQTALPRDGSVG